jgi:pimeloyl-ACP methyl ester carboxylesterase
VVMPVAIVRTADPNPAPDPVLYLSGGPGGAALPTAEGFLRQGHSGNRDTILLEQRGTGRSEPHLDCPEVTAAFATIFSQAAPFDTESKIGNDALRVCRDRIRATGVDLNQYNTAAVADDIADLRTAMGISEWNLFGVSYGTMDALVTMRTHPAGIRSVVLDSVIPPDVGTGAPEVFAAYERVVRVLFDGCARDARCHAAFPNLEADVNATVAAFDQSPYRGSVDDPLTHQATPIVITGADLASGMFLAFSETALIPVLPSIVEQLKSGAVPAIMDQLALRAIDFGSSLSVLDSATVNCHDHAAQRHDGDDVRLVAQHPDAATMLLFTTVSCTDFGVTGAAQGFNDPVHSDIPTLLLGDEYDPLTPPEQAQHAAETLSHSTFVKFPGLGHGAVFAGRDCPGLIFRAFLATPTATVDTACVASMGPPPWTVPG